GVEAVIEIEARAVDLRITELDPHVRVPSQDSPLALRRPKPIDEDANRHALLARPARGPKDDAPETTPAFREKTAIVLVAHAVDEPHPLPRRAVVEIGADLPFGVEGRELHLSKGHSQETLGGDRRGGRSPPGGALRSRQGSHS